MSLTDAGSANAGNPDQGNIPAGTEMADPGPLSRQFQAYQVFVTIGTFVLPVKKYGPHEFCSTPSTNR